MKRSGMPEDGHGLTRARLLELLRYDPRTGVFTWRRTQGHKTAGSVAGTSNGAYIQISIDKVKHLAHRLAWLYVTGKWPMRFLDHRDLDKTNNRFRNLREATKQGNGANICAKRTNTTGFKGVIPARYGRYRSEITCNRVRHYLGTFHTKKAARAAYAAAAARLHGTFARI